MTLVTTSRHPAQGLRAIARDLAFALEARYLPRGKHGLRDIAEEDPLFFVFSQERKEVVLSIHTDDEEQPLTRYISNVLQDMREDKMERGIRTSDTGLLSILNERLNISYIESEIPILVFDGPQRRRITLSLKEEGSNA